MMGRHDTPPEVAAALARWAPRPLVTLLDPCVGAGALLSPLLRGADGAMLRAIGIDRDQKAIDAVSRQFGGALGPSLSLFCCDFLRWEGGQGQFDCVVMNPPFDGRRKVACRVLTGRVREYSTVHVPIEAAFVLKAIGLVKPRGRLLAILPGSVISAKSGASIRRHLLHCGRILCVHELANYTFAGIESRVYMLVFEVGVKSGAIKLFNHSLDEPDQLAVSPRSLGDELRLDFGYHQAFADYRSAQQALPGVSWVKLSDLAAIKRGSLASARHASEAAHTTDYHEGFWNLERFGVCGTYTLDGICPSDLLLRRVGRRCAGSLGLALGNAPAWTDCVLRIRPKKRGNAVRFLFCVRALFTTGWGRQLVERGSGATYISAADLGEVLVPSRLWSIQPDTFAAYEAAVSRRRFQRMLQLEREVAGELMRRCSAAA